MEPSQTRLTILPNVFQMQKNIYSKRTKSNNIQTNCKRETLLVSNEVEVTATFFVWESFGIKKSKRQKLVWLWNASWT